MHLVRKKCKRDDDVLFINPTAGFERGKGQNRLLEEHVTKVLDTYREHKEETRYSRRVGMAEIRKNGMNLNISRYVRTAEAEEEIDLAKVHEELVAADSKIKAATAKHNAFLKEGFPVQEECYSQSVVVSPSTRMADVNTSQSCL